MSAVLVVAEHNNDQLKPATLRTVTAAKEIARATGQDIDILVAGRSVDAVAAAAAAIPGIAKVLLADDPALEHGLAENLAPLVASLAGGYEYVLAPASSFGKNVMPRVAALLDVAQISDISSVKDAETFVRPIHAGTLLATVRSKDRIKVITVRPSAFAVAEAQTGQAPVEKVQATAGAGLSEHVAVEVTKSDHPDLSSARVVISGGRGLQSAENFKLLDGIAELLGGAIGASRAAVDAGYVSNDYQIGQTGKIVAPDLYIAVGLSGAVQHLAGMKDSKVIVAINKDEDAPIFQVADYGLVGDLFTILPQLRAELEKD